MKMPNRRCTTVVDMRGQLFLRRLLWVLLVLALLCCAICGPMMLTFSRCNCRCDPPVRSSMLLSANNLVPGLALSSALRIVGKPIRNVSGVREYGWGFFTLGRSGRIDWIRSGSIVFGREFVSNSPPDILLPALGKPDVYQESTGISFAYYNVNSSDTLRVNIIDGKIRSFELFRDEDESLSGIPRHE